MGVPLEEMDAVFGEGQFTGQFLLDGAQLAASASPRSHREPSSERSSLMGDQSISHTRRQSYEATTQDSGGGLLRYISLDRLFGRKDPREQRVAYQSIAGDEDDR